METPLAISIGINIGFVASFFIRRRHVRKLWDWIRGRRRPKEDLQDLMCCLKPEPTPLVQMQHASFGSPPHSYTKKKLLPEGEKPWDWDLQYDENGKPYLTERCRAR